MDTESDHHRQNAWKVGKMKKIIKNLNGSIILSILNSLWQIEIVFILIYGGCLTSYERGGGEWARLQLFYRGTDRAREAKGGPID